MCEWKKKLPVDASEAIAALDAIMTRIEGAGPEIVSKGALAVQQAGMGLTHVVSGTLRRSWHVTVAGNTAEVGPTTVYARRQELGFAGADSLGRVYDTPGWPYVKPAFEATLPRIQQYAEQAYADAIGG